MHCKLGAIEKSISTIVLQVHCKLGAIEKSISTIVLQMHCKLGAIENKSMLQLLQGILGSKLDTSLQRKNFRNVRADDLIRT